MNEPFLSAIGDIHGFNDVIQKEMHTAEPHVPETSVFEFQLAIEKL
jgi:hypothetical protein